MSGERRSREPAWRAPVRRRLGPLLDGILLTRPRQWPILSCQLAVGILLAPACRETLLGEAAAAPQWGVLAAAWTTWVLCLNGGTLAYNSACDRDVEDIAYLGCPPPPPRRLAPVAIALMGAGVAAGFLVDPRLALLTAGAMILSVLYSSPRTRWKGRPGLDLLVNVLGYGFGTTVAGIVAGNVAWGGTASLDRGDWMLAAAFGLLFGSIYPLTQIYQIRADRGRSDRTLASALGIRASLWLALGLGAAAGVLLLSAAAGWRPDWSLRVLAAPAAAILLWQAHLVLWLRRAGVWDDARHERGMYHALSLWAVVDLALLAACYVF